MTLLSALDWRIRLLLAGVVAVGVGIGVFLLVRTSGNGSNEQVVVLATATPAVVAPTPSAATPASTQPAATTTQPSAATPTPDTRVAIRDLPTLDQIQLGSDGKYFVADRGDGCRWVEHARSVNEVAGESVVLSTDCPTDFGYEFYPATGGIFLLVP